MRTNATIALFQTPDVVDVYEIVAMQLGLSYSRMPQAVHVECDYEDVMLVLDLMALEVPPRSATPGHVWYECKASPSGQTSAGVQLSSVDHDWSWEYDRAPSMPVEFTPGFDGLAWGRAWAETEAEREGRIAELQLARGERGPWFDLSFDPNDEL